MREINSPAINSSTLDKIYDLLQRGKDPNFAALVRDNAEAVEAVIRAIKRMQQIAPDVAVSPYINRAMRILKGENATEAGDTPMQQAA